MRNGLIVDGEANEAGIVAALKNIHITFQHNEEEGGVTTYLNDENVEKEIRGVEVSEQVTKVSQLKEVRSHLIGLQREMGAQKGVVMDGRDIGTVVFPDAALKLYVTAELGIRAQRRFEQMQKAGRQVTLDEVKSNLERRDYDDIHKGERPLRKAEDAIEIDTSYMSLQEQSALALKYAKAVTEKG
jgi:cytidylate kinase